MVVGSNGVLGLALSVVQEAQIEPSAVIGRVTAGDRLQKGLGSTQVSLFKRRLGLHEFGGQGGILDRDSVVAHRLAGVLGKRSDNQARDHD